MAYLLFFIYLLLLSWIVTKIRFIKKTGLTARVIVLLFLTKIIAGLTIGYFTKDITNDYWPLNADSLNEQHLLLTDPRTYFTNIFHSGYKNGYGGFLDALPSYWNDLRITLISKVLAWFNFLSGGNYYINSLFYNFFGFFGHIAFYRLFIQVYPSKKIAVIISCFLLPSMLYFSSGVQKDGIVFTALGVLCYTVYQSLYKNNFSAGRIIIIMLALAILFLIRSYVVLLILPGLFFWILTVKKQWPVLIIFTTGYSVVVILFFSLHYVTGGRFNPLEAVTKKQEAFFMLEKASTQLQLDTLKPEWMSFARNAPQAFNHSFLRPYVTEITSRSLVPVAFETFFYQALFLIFLFCHYKSPKSLNNQAFITAGVFFAVSILLFIGFIVPNLGSIVRYRSIYLIFLITPVLAGIDCETFIKSIKIKK